MNGHVMNRAERRAVNPGPQMDPGDIRLNRAKVILMDAKFLGMILSMDGSHAFRMTKVGMAEGMQMQIIGMTVFPPDKVVLLVWHPELPVNLTGQPEQMLVQVEAFKCQIVENEDAGSTPEEA